MERIIRVSRLFCVSLLLAVAVGVSGAAYAAGEGWLGVMLQPLSDEIVAAMSLEKGTTGVLVSDVVDDSPADEAGFEKGDIIVEVDGAAITDVDGAIAKVKDLDPGTKVKMVVVREGKKQVLTVVLGDRTEMPGKTEMAGKAEGKDDDDGEDVEEYYNLRIPRVERIFKDIRIGGGGYIGVEIRDVSADLGAYFGVAAGEGVLILEVVDDSPAEEAGLRAGDVIIKVDGEDVGCSGEFASYVRDREPGQTLDITFKRSKETRRMTVEVGEGPDATRIFLNQAGEPDAFTWMGGESGDCKEKCIRLGDKCLMIGKDFERLGKECARHCEMMAKECRGKAMECQGKMMKCREKATECPGMAKEGDEKKVTIECHRSMEAPPLPGKSLEHAEMGRPSEEQIKVLKVHGGEGRGVELRAQIDELKKEIEQLKQEMEALRKP